jgi:hypothetical protein
MNAFSHNDLSHQNADTLRALAVEQSQLLALATNEADDTYWKNLNSLKKRTKNSYFL